MKKVLILLCVVLLLAAPLFVVHAEEPVLQRDETLVKEASQLYRSCLYSSGRSSFRGMCGLSTSYQLWKLGINKYMEVYDGNDQFDAYCNRKSTSGGHSIEAYSAKEYTLGEALNRISRNGTRPVRNILVGFQRTNTAAGRYYGHSCLINAIQDGTVYFTESFDYVLGRAEGQVVTCTIDQFVDFFDNWTTFEGVIYFGTKQYANSCQSYGTDLYVQLRFDSNLRSQPCVLGKNESVVLRNLTAGELLHVTAVYQNDEDDLFYQIDDGGVVGYVSANAVHVIRRDDQGLRLETPNIPVSMEPGENPKLSGKVISENCQLHNVSLTVEDQTGTVVMQVQAEVSNNQLSLSQLNKNLSLKKLPAGNYTLNMVAEISYAEVKQGKVTVETVTRTVVSQPLDVGADGQAEADPECGVIKNGWFLEDGVWYCYKDGQPCTGWVDRVGVTYYLKEDGSVTTGWMDDDENSYFFSATGALCDGWVTTEEGSYYWVDGVMVTGLQQIDGKYYCFGGNGTMLLSGEVTYGGIVYKINGDGTAVPAV